MNVRFRKLCLIGLCLVLVQSLIGAGFALAQEEPPDRPPLPPIGGDGGNGGSTSDRDDDDGNGDDDARPQPPGASVSGKVYDYSGYHYAGGVTVVVDGGGWQAETVTDSNGYYRIDGLGAGPAVVKLRLPPGAHPVSSGWPIILGQGANRNVDLGYYWGDASPLAVQLSGELEGDVLNIRVTNTTPEPVPGLELEVTLPSVLRGTPGIQTSQGALAAYDPHALQIDLGQLASRGGATVQAPLTLVQESSRPQRARAADIRIILTYEQQITPQVVTVDSQPAIQAGQSSASVRPATTAGEFQPPAQQPNGMQPLPTTGDNAATTLLTVDKLVMPLLLVLALATAGLWAMKTRR